MPAGCQAATCSTRMLIIGRLPCHLNPMRLGGSEEGLRPEITSLALYFSKLSFERLRRTYRMVSLQVEI